MKRKVYKLKGWQQATMLPSVQVQKKERASIVTPAPAMATVTPKAETPLRHSVKGPAPKPPGSKDLPITDSRGPKPEPPKSFFGAKPLVTIGSYPDGSNPRPNRFARSGNIDLIESDKG